jgi:hypothetical protein
MDTYRPIRSIAIIDAAIHCFLFRRWVVALDLRGFVFMKFSKK